MESSWALAASYVGIATLSLMYTRLAAEEWGGPLWTRRALAVAAFVGASLYFATVVMIVGSGVSAWL
ncbi:MAG TPA: hypothetical protein VF234_03045 [Limnochordia bacterium]